MSLRTRLGWDPFFENQCAPGTIVARVVQVERDAWRVEGDVDCWATIAGRLRHETEKARDLPAVGDWVEIGVHEVREDREAHEVPRREGQIVRRLERKSVLSRTAAGRAVDEQVIAANVDTVFVVTSANDELSERRLERYLAMIWDSGATPVIVVNKSDLVDDPDSVAASLRARLPLADIIALSALHSAALISEAQASAVEKACATADVAKPFRGATAAALGPYLQPGKTVALVGSSGVGKSTIVNRLVGAEVQKVSTIRESDNTGRHTTTARQLIALPGGALLIDTPGMRELQPWGVAGVEGAFDDIVAAAESCRFSDCSHDTEPGCGVRAAVDDGTLSADRLEHYRRLQREAAYEERRQNKGAAAVQKKRLKTMMRAQKALYRDRDRLK